MVPHGKYCILFHRMKSGKIHWNIRRCSSQILEGHSICPLHLHQLVEQCLIHYDDNTNVWLGFWPHAFTSTQPCSIIQIAYRCKYDKPIQILVMLCDLSEWCFLNIVQSPLLSYSPCRLRESHVLHKSVSNGSILINIHELLALILLLISKRLLSEIPTTRKRLLYRLWNLHQGHHMWNLHGGLRLLMVSNSSVHARSMGNISPSRFE